MNNVWENIEKFEAFEITDIGLTVRKPMTITNTKLIVTDKLGEAFLECFNKAKLLKTQKQLLETYLTLSKGRVIFEFTDEEIARELYKDEIQKKEPNKERLRCMKVNVASRLETLLSWQERTGIEFLRVIRDGYGTKEDKGQYGWSKDKYEFVLLSRWIQIQSENSESSLESNLEKLEARYNVKMKNSKNN